MRKMKLLTVLSIAAFAGMLVYGAFIQSVEVTQSVELTDRELKGLDLVAKSAADKLSKVGGRIIEDTKKSDLACPT